jgi:hypothetical protein
VRKGLIEVFETGFCEEIEPAGATSLEDLSDEGSSDVLTAIVLVDCHRGQVARSVGKVHEGHGEGDHGPISNRNHSDGGRSGKGAQRPCFQPQAADLTCFTR